MGPGVEGAQGTRPEDGEETHDDDWMRLLGQGLHTVWQHLDQILDDPQFIELCGIWDDDIYDSETIERENSLMRDLTTHFPAVYLLATHLYSHVVSE